VRAQVTGTMTATPICSEPPARSQSIVRPLGGQMSTGLDRAGDCSVIEAMAVHHQC
jgi:hypothetical protein